MDFRTRVRRACITAATALSVSTGANAETLTIETIYPAGSDEAAMLESIAVDRFAGREGPSFANRIEERLIDASIDGVPYFTLIHRSQADEADAILAGEARVRVSETEFGQRRKICVEKDADGDCLRRENVELSCLRLSVGIRPQADLRAVDGTVIWSRRFASDHTLSYCPGYDDEPLVDPVVEAALAAAADEVRRELAPFQVVQDIRIMERRKGLSKPVAQQFRAAIALTKTDEGAACDLFASLEPDAPSHPSLQFNLGLCAEQIGDFERARAYYDAALADKSSDDEAQAGIFRLQSNIAAERQLAMRVD